MHDLLCRARAAAARFMYGRNGGDALGWALLALYAALSVAGRFAHTAAARAVLSLLGLAAAIAALWRMLSRDLPKRRAENARFLRWWTPVRTLFRDARRRRADKAHRYVKCACGAWCRVPRGIGRVEMLCPRCGAKRIVET